MTYSLTYLIENSKLPGPRSNLELLYQFMDAASKAEIQQCLQVDVVALNCPEEFVLSCGVAGSILSDAKEEGKVTFDYRPYANHGSWRVREAVCIGFQRSKDFLSPQQMESELASLQKGTALEQRTYVATLCEPALFKQYIDPNKVLESLVEITLENFRTEVKLSEELTSLRKALGYCFSVALCAEGANLDLFETLLTYKSHKHIRWIIQENLKKKRLEKKDAEWVIKLKKEIQ